MKERSQNYVLIVQQPSRDLPTIEPLAQTLNCPVITTTSPMQALAQAQARPPHLVILSGDDGYTWSSQVARQIRARVQPETVVIVAVTASSDRSWLPEEDTAEIDGFFVEPLSADILSTVNESAMTKKNCLTVI